MKKLIVSAGLINIVACSPIPPVPNAVGPDVATVVIKSNFEDVHILRRGEEMFGYVSKRAANGEFKIIGQMLLDKDSPSHVVTLAPNEEYGFGFNIMEKIPFQEKDCMMGVAIKAEPKQTYVVSAQYPRQVEPEVFSGCVVAAFHESDLDTPISFEVGQLKVRNVFYTLTPGMSDQEYPATRVLMEPVTGRDLAAED